MPERDVFSSGADEAVEWGTPQPPTHGGTVWVIQDDEQPHLWMVSWDDGDHEMGRKGTKVAIRGWAATRPADEWRIFTNERREWLPYDPDADLASLTSGD